MAVTVDAAYGMGFWSAGRESGYASPPVRQHNSRHVHQTMYCGQPSVMTPSHKNHMSADRVADDRTAFRRFHDALNTGDADVTSKTIDEIVNPNVLFHARGPSDTTGAQAIRHVWAPTPGCRPHFAAVAVHADATGSDA